MLPIQAQSARCVGFPDQNCCSAVRLTIRFLCGMLVGAKAQCMSCMVISEYIQCTLREVQQLMVNLIYFLKQQQSGSSALCQ